jgi:hypothetical protein
MHTYLYSFLVVVYRGDKRRSRFSPLEREETEDEGGTDNTHSQVFRAILISPAFTANPHPQLTT